MQIAPAQDMMQVIVQHTEKHQQRVLQGGAPVHYQQVLSDLKKL